MRRKLMTPDHFLGWLWTKIKPRWRIAFFSSIIIGFICHIFVFVNTLPNHDWMSNFHSPQDILVLGRWFLSIACAPSSYFNLPWVIGLFTLVYYGLASAALAEVLELDHPLTIVLTSGIVVGFPSVTATFAYMFTADGYAMGYLFAVLAVLLLKKYKYGFLFGALLLTLSLGIYQAQLAVALVLILLLLFIAALRADVKLRPLLIFILRAAVMVLAAAVLYYLVLQLRLAMGGVALTNYQGMDVLSAPLSSSLFGRLWHGIKAAYLDAPAFFLSYSPYGFSLAKLGIVAYGAYCMGLVVWHLISGRLARPWWRLPLLALTALMLPLALNVVLLISPSADYHILMRSSYGLLLIAGIVFSDKLLPKPDLAKTVLRWAAVLLSAFLVLQGALIANIAYYNLQQRYEKVYAQTLLMAERIVQTPDFEADTPVLFTGWADSGLTPGADKFTPFYLKGMIGVEGNTFLYNDFHYKRFFEYYQGFLFADATDGQVEAIRATGAYAAMPLWPAEGSVGWIDGVLVVKVGNHYLE